MSCLGIGSSGSYPDIQLLNFAGGILDDPAHGTRFKCVFIIIGPCRIDKEKAFPDIIIIFNANGIFRSTTGFSQFLFFTTLQAGNPDKTKISHLHCGLETKQSLTFGAGRDIVGTGQSQGDVSRFDGLNYFILIPGVSKPQGVLKVKGGLTILVHLYADLVSHFSFYLKLLGLFEAWTKITALLKRRDRGTLPAFGAAGQFEGDISGYPQTDPVATKYPFKSLTLNLNRDI